MYSQSLTSNGALLVLLELSLDEAQHQTGLPHRWLPKKDQLELEDLIGCRGGTGPAGRHGRTLLLVGCHKRSLYQTQTQALMVVSGPNLTDPPWSQVRGKKLKTSCHAMTHKNETYYYYYYYYKKSYLYIYTHIHYTWIINVTVYKIQKTITTFMTLQLIINT